MSKKIDISKEVIYQKYIIEKKTIKVISKELNVCYKIIRREITKYKLDNIRKPTRGFAYLIEYNPKRFIELQIKGNRKRHEKYPNLSKETGYKNFINNIGMFSKESRKKATEVNKKNKTGIFNPEVRIIANSKGGKIGTETNRRNKTGFFDPKVQSMGGKIGGKITAEINRRNKKGPYFDKELQRKGGIKGGKKGGKKSEEVRRKNSPYLLEGVGFLSKEEMKVAQIILTKPIVGINCHIKVNGSIVDFFPQSYDKMFQGKFVEYHPWDRKLTTEEYYNKRRKLLDENGFSDKELIVIDNQKFIKENGGNKK